MEYLKKVPIIIYLGVVKSRRVVAVVATTLRLIWRDMQIR